MASKSAFLMMCRRTSTTPPPLIDQFNRSRHKALPKAPQLDCCFDRAPEFKVSRPCCSRTLAETYEPKYLMLRPDTIGAFPMSLIYRTKTSIIDCMWLILNLNGGSKFIAFLHDPAPNGR